MNMKTNTKTKMKTTMNMNVNMTMPLSPIPIPIEQLPPAKHLGEYIRTPPPHAKNNRFIMFIWRWHLWFECTFGLTVMEPWERMVVCTSFPPFDFLFYFILHNLIYVLSFSDAFRYDHSTRMHRAYSILSSKDHRFTTKNGILSVGISYR